MTSRVEVTGTRQITYSQTWDVDNRLIDVLSGTQHTQFFYDADGQRVKRVTPQSTTWYVSADYEVTGPAPVVTITVPTTYTHKLYMPFVSIAQTNGPCHDTCTYYQFNGQQVAVRTGGTVYWLHRDHQGSASATTDIFGTKVSELRYKPYGETRYSSGSTPTDKRFTSQEEQTGIGLYDYGTRFYSPLLGRFISADSIVPRPGDPQSLNRYSYARNSPLVRVDPSGHADCAAGDSACWTNEWMWKNRWYEAHGHFWDGKDWNTNGTPRFADTDILKQTISEVGAFLIGSGQPVFSDEIGGSGEQHRAVQWAYFLYLLELYGLRAQMEVRLINDTRADLLLISKYSSSKVWVWEIKPDNPIWRVEGPIQLAGYTKLIGGTPGFELPPLSVPLGEFIISAYSDGDTGMIYYKGRSTRTDLNQSYSPIPSMDMATYYTLLAAGAIGVLGGGIIKWNTSGAYGW